MAGLSIESLVVAHVFSEDCLVPPAEMQEAWVPGNLPLQPPVPTVAFKTKHPVDAECVQGSPATEPGLFSSEPATTPTVPHSSCTRLPSATKKDQAAVVPAFITGSVSSNEWHQAPQSHNPLRRTHESLLSFFSLPQTTHLVPGTLPHTDLTGRHFAPSPLLQPSPRHLPLEIFQGLLAVPSFYSCLLQSDQDNLIKTQQVHATTQLNTHPLSFPLHLE